jgi:nucleotide-binding universal stress UspA family protein
MIDQPVILCYDGSEDAKLAIEHAGALFAGRPAVVLAVWQGAHAQLGYSWAGTDLDPETFERLDEAAEKAAQGLAAGGAEIARAAGLTAGTAVARAQGPIWPPILSAAEERDAAAIVIGSRGLSGIKSIVLGSVSGGVVHHATRPVLVVRHGIAHPAAT